MHSNKPTNLPHLADTLLFIEDLRSHFDLRQVYAEHKISEKFFEIADEFFSMRAMRSSDWAKPKQTNHRVVFCFTIHHKLYTG